MTNGLLQCCYTNNGGWGMFAVSGGIPETARKYCGDFQNVNSTIPSSGWLAENGDPLNLYEIHSDGSYVYVCRTQYGLHAADGRNNMFSHAYILPWSEDTLRNPNNFLTISDEMFGKSIEEAEREREASYTEPMSLRSAMDALQMGEEEYRTLIRAVYLQILNSGTLYVQYDGSEQEMKNLLYCIYVGLPYSARKALRIASAAANAPDRMRVIFSTHATAKKCYIVPSTGENNALSESDERKLDRLGYVDHAIIHHIAKENPEEIFNKFFDNLEKHAAMLGDSTASDSLILKIVYQLREGYVPDLDDKTELVMLLSDMVSSKTVGSDRMDEFISEAVLKICEKNMELTDTMWGKIARRADASENENLKAAAKRYYIGMLRTMGSEQAVDSLLALPEKSASEYMKELFRSEKWDITDRYFEKKLFGVETRELTWELILDACSLAVEIGGRDRYGDQILQKASDLFLLTMPEGDSLDQALNAFAEIAKTCVGKNNAGERVQMLKEQYWGKESTFRLDREEDYRKMDCGCERSKMYLSLFDLAKVKPFESFLNKWVDYIRTYGRMMNTEIQESIVKCLPEQLSDEPEGAVTQDKGRWMREILRCWNMKDVNPVINVYRGVYKDSSKLCNSIETYIKERQTGATTPANNGTDWNEKSSKDHFYKTKPSDKDSEFFKFVYEECLPRDASEHFPLEVWLRLGYGISRGNDPFCVFDNYGEYRPEVLSMEPVSVVEECSLFRKYLTMAKDYASKEESLEKKVVKQWIKAVDKADHNDMMGKISDKLKGFTENFGGKHRR